MGKLRATTSASRVALALALVVVLAGTGCTWIGRQSVSSTGAEARGSSDQVTVSADGRFVAFASDAPDVIPFDVNSQRDVFVRDNVNGAVTRVSVTTEGNEANGASSHPSISDDGRYIAFESEASNLTADDTNSGTDVFVRDQILQTTVLASPARGGTASAVARAAATGGPVARKLSPAYVGPPASNKPAANGTVRVVVRARGPFVPEASLAPAARLEQRTDLTARRQDVERAVQAVGGQIVRSIDGQPFVAARVPAASVGALRRAPSVRQVVSDRVMRPTDLESNALIGSDVANAAGFDGRGAAVAIIDTGVDGTHPFLAGRIVAEGCFTSSASCPNGQNTQTGAGSAAPCTVDGCFHGTHVAGIAAGRRVAGGTYDGVAPAATIIAVQIFSFDPFCQCLGAFSSDIIAALQFVSSLRNTFPVAAANMSLGGGPLSGPCDDDPIKPAVDDLRAAGIATVIASGNEGSVNGISSPACISSAVSVGAVDNFDVPPFFSNSGPGLSLLAPGVNVESSIPGGSFVRLSGTSMATPHVAGMWALIKQRAPDASVSDVLAWLGATGRRLRDPRNGVVTPRVCAAVALGLGACPEPFIPPPPPNDDFADALPLVGDAGTVTGTNVGAGMQFGEPAHASVPVAASVWYSFTARTDGDLAVATLGSTFDTVLAMYRGDAVDFLVALGGNDDSGSTLQSVVGPIRVEAGTTYRIAVAGFFGETGDVSLSWGFRATLGDNTGAAISGDGRSVAFSSDVASLVADDTNRTDDVFVRDLRAGVTTRVSFGINGNAGDGPSSQAAMSGDGSHVAFASQATNLVDADTNGTADVFVRRVADATSIRKVSRASNGNGANGPSGHPALNYSGTIIAFDSDASNMVAQDTNQVRDVFVLQGTEARVRRVSLAYDGTEGDGPAVNPSVSADGRFVAFTSGAFNLVPLDGNSVDDIMVRDRREATTRRVSTTDRGAESDAASSGAAITRDGAYVAFSSLGRDLVLNDLNGASDVFLRRRQPATITSVIAPGLSRGEQRDLVIEGSGFLPGTQVIISGSGVVVTWVTATSPTRLTATVQVAADAPLGSRAIVVEVPGAWWDALTGAAAVCPDCLQISS